MQRTTIVTAMAVLVLLGVATNRLAVGEPDQVLQSFEREFKHEPSPPAATRRDSIDTDELYSIVNSVHWTRDDQFVADAKETTAGDSDDEEQANN